MAELDKTTPWKMALQKLKEGNLRFTSGIRSTDALNGHMRLAQLAKNGQNPFAIVLSCSDSRVPAEHVFDCGFGDLFVIRVAGNIVQPSQIASIEYAVHVLGCKLLVVMGHTKCGAVQAALDHVKTPAGLPTKNLETLIGLIEPSVKRVLDRKKRSDSDDLLTACVHENVEGVSQDILKASPLLKDLVLKQNIKIEKSVFNIETGHVLFSEGKDSNPAAAHLSQKELFQPVAH